MSGDTTDTSSMHQHTSFLLLIRESNLCDSEHAARASTASCLQHNHPRLPGQICGVAIDDIRLWLLHLVVSASTGNFPSTNARRVRFHATRTEWPTTAKRGRKSRRAQVSGRVSTLRCHTGGRCLLRRGSDVRLRHKFQTQAHLSAIFRSHTRPTSALLSSSNLRATGMHPLGRGTRRLSPASRRFAPA